MFESYPDIVDQVSYLTDIGNILGSLTVNQDIILFDPALTEYNKNLTVNKQGYNIVHQQRVTSQNSNYVFN